MIIFIHLININQRRRGKCSQLDDIKNEGYCKDYTFAIGEVIKHNLVILTMTNHRFLFCCFRCAEHTLSASDVYNPEGAAASGCVSRHGRRGPCSLLQADPARPQHLQEQEL